MHETDYPNTGTRRWIVAILGGAPVVVLDDGSRWRVAPAHWPTVRGWPQTTVIAVDRDHEAGPDFVLRTEYGERATAIYLGFRPLGAAEPGHWTGA